MKTSRLDIRVLAASLLIILVLAGKLWVDYDEESAEERTEDMEGVAGVFKIRSEILGEERTIEVCLPEGYGDSEEAYPVLYFLDAEMVSRFTDVIDMVESQHATGVLPRMIVVGIHNTNRNRDTIPVSVEARPESGGSLNFLRFLDSELIPLIDESYRTSHPRVLYGASNAGLFVVYALLKSPDSFDAYIASSPMIGWCPDYIHGLAEETLSEPLQDKFLFMIYGSEDYVRVTRDVPGFVDLMQGKSPEGLRWESRILEGVGHVPADSLEEGLKALFFDGS